MKPSAPLLCYITDRRALAPRPLLECIIEAMEAGVDLVQIREKDLPAPDLLELATTAAHVAGRHAARATRPRVILNDRLDVALAAGAHGVHLGGSSMPTCEVRAALSARHDPAFWVGVSCHSAGDVKQAEDAGADYALLGPIFETPSKLIYGPPLGLKPLEQAARASKMPVLALGGITVLRVKSCLEAGASGVAGISIFQSCSSLESRVSELRSEVEAFLGARRRADPKR
jgi:thiamine-phosphate pyrophosphorylase